MSTVAVMLTSSSSETPSGRSVALTWVTQANGSTATAPAVFDSCTASDGWTGFKNANGGTELVTPTDVGSDVFTLTCGSQQAQTVVTVTPPLQGYTYQPTIADLVEMVVFVAIAFSFFVGYKTGIVR